MGKGKKIGLGIGIVFGIFLVLGVIGYAVSGGKTSSSIANSNSTPDIQEIELREYRNIPYQFSIEYPSNWIVDEDMTEIKNTGLYDGDIVVFRDKYPNPTDVILVKNKNYPTSDIDDAFVMFKSETASRYQIRVDSEKKTVINGAEAYELRYTSFFATLDDQCYSKDYLVKGNGNYLSIEYSKCGQSSDKLEAGLPLFERVASTVRIQNNTHENVNTDKNTNDEAAQETSDIQPVASSFSTVSSSAEFWASLDKVSIPSEQLLELCSSNYVMSRYDTSVWEKCDQMMDIMTMDYCQHDPPTQYAFTLCRDDRYFKFYGVEPKYDNLPDPSDVLKIGEKTTIQDLEFWVVGYSAMNNNRDIFVVVNVTNHSSEPKPLDKSNFAIIDEMGNIFTDPYVSISKPYINPQFNSEHLTSIPGQTSYEIDIQGSTTYYNNNIIRIIFSDEVVYFALNNE